MKKQKMFFRVLLCAVLCLSLLIPSGCIGSDSGGGLLSGKLLLSRSLSSLPDSLPFSFSAPANKNYKSFEMNLSVQINQALKPILPAEQRELLDGLSLNLKGGSGADKFGLSLALLKGGDSFLSLSALLSKNNILLSIPEIFDKTLSVSETPETKQVFDMLAALFENQKGGANSSKALSDGLEGFLADLEKAFLSAVPQGAYGEGARDLSEYGLKNVKEIVLTMDAEIFADALKATLKEARGHKYMDTLKKWLDENMADTSGIFSSIILVPGMPSGMMPEPEKMSEQLDKTLAEAEENIGDAVKNVDEVVYTTLYTSSLFSAKAVGREIYAKVNGEKAGVYCFYSGDGKGGTVNAYVWANDKGNKQAELLCAYKNNKGRTEGELTLKAGGNALEFTFSLDQKKTTSTGDSLGTYTLSKR